MAHLLFFLRRRFRLGILATAWVALLPAVAPTPAAAQSLGEPLIVFPDLERSQTLPVVTAQPGGDFAMAWLWPFNEFFVPEDPTQMGGVVATDGEGRPIYGPGTLGLAPGALFGPDGFGGFRIDAAKDGGIVVSLYTSLDLVLSQEQLIQRFSPLAAPLGDLYRVFGEDTRMLFPRLAVVDDGSLISSLLVLDTLRVGAAMAGPRDEILRLPFQITEMAPPGQQLKEQNHPGIDASPDGSFVVTWREDPVPFTRAEVWAQRFDPAGQPLTPPLELGLGSRRGRVPLGVADDGSFQAVWTGGEFPVETIEGQAFYADGRPAGPKRILAPATPDLGSEQIRFLRGFAVDPRGGGVATWSFQSSQLGPASLVGRFLNRRGVPQGPSFLVAEEITDASVEGVALKDDGSALAVWIQEDPATGLHQTHARTLAAPRDDELCVHRGPELHCDTANDSGAFEETLRFGLGPEAGDRALLGDIDGDGEDDYCLRRNALFLCDADGRGAPSEFKQRFGLRSHGALLGDMDGDGDDDPCLRIGRRLACDLEHDGPPSEYRQVFGGFGEDLLLGDIDGDGRDEACLYRGTRFLCDPQQQGSPASFRSDPIGTGTGTPLLGDVDGDGRDDLCVLEASGALLCDVARDGSPPVSALLDVEPGDTPLLGNIDGF